MIALIFYILGGVMALATTNEEGEQCTWLEAVLWPVFACLIVIDTARIMWRKWRGEDA